jgi:purine nucleosidase
MAPHRILLDCDPGQDDAIAILLAVASAEIEIAAITTVAGNVGLPLTTRNALRVLALAGRKDIPVYAGCARPILRPLETAEYVHGKSGLDGAALPEPTTEVAAGHAVDVIVDEIMRQPAGAVTLCPIGPLTNVALAIVKQPEIVPRLKEVVLMGGAMELGNVTAAAEFNIFVDPHAARVVFESGVPIVMLGLDVTHKALVTDERLTQIKAIGTPVATACAGLLDFFNRYDKERYHVPGAPLHDPCVIAYLLAPELFSGRHINVEIETQSPLTLGMTVADWWRVTDRAPNAMFIGGVDREGFYGLLSERLGRV